MAFFTVTQAALAAGRTVFLERLVFFDFVDEPTFVWTGWGNVVIDGDTYVGLGLIGSISEITVTLNDSAGKVDFMLSGVSPEVVALAKDSAKVRGRAVAVYGQFFDEDLQPADDKFTMTPPMTMDTLSFGGSGPSDRRIRVSAESIFVGRNSATQSFFSDRDQQIRFPGDKGLERMSTLAHKRVIWPAFE